MSTQSLLYQRSIKINDYISVVIPTVGQLLDNEDDYYGDVSVFTSMPIDLMVQLDDIGIDFTEINEYELFLMLFNGLKGRDTSLLFGDLDLNNFDLAVNEQNQTLVLYDPVNDITIDRAIHAQVANAFRKILHQEKNRKRPANKEAQDYMIQRERIKQKRRKRKKEDSQLESLIVAMVNTEQFKYNYETVKDMSIYQFNESVSQIIYKVDYEHRMSGVYAGTIDTTHMSKEDFNWLIHK